MDTLNLPKDIAFRIELPSFEGPLDLLLHLIKKHELDVLDLPIAFVTERYLQYLQMMQELDLDVASEYLLMAATLAHIKSKSLLPPSPKDEEDDVDDDYMEDPRAELIRRLLEYQKYKQAAQQLHERPIPGRDVFTRGTPAPKAQGQAPLAEVGLFKLLDAFEGILKRVRGKVAFEVTAERISIQERMTQITELLRVRKVCEFTELFESDHTRYDVVVTFLALLEMTKLHVTRLSQADTNAPICVTYALLDAGEAERVQQAQAAAQAELAASAHPAPAEISPEEVVHSPWSTLDPDLEALEEEFGQDFDVNEWLLEHGDDDAGDDSAGDKLLEDEQAWTSLAPDPPAGVGQDLVEGEGEAFISLEDLAAAEALLDYDDTLSEAEGAHGLLDGEGSTIEDALDGDDSSPAWGEAPATPAGPADLTRNERNPVVAAESSDESYLTGAMLEQRTESGSRLEGAVVARSPQQAEDDGQDMDVTFAGAAPSLRQGADLPLACANADGVGRNDGTLPPDSAVEADNPAAELQAAAELSAAVEIDEATACKPAVAQAEDASQVDEAISPAATDSAPDTPERSDA